VITVKWVEWISSQGFGSGAAEADIEHMNRPHNVSESEMAGMRRMGRGEWDPSREMLPRLACRLALL
jgi:hypothetical protein